MNRPNRSSYLYTSTRATRNLTPIERWESENAADQPWDGIAAFKTSSGWRESFGDKATSSTNGQNGSVDEQKN
jgi:hypothetical protein